MENRQLRLEIESSEVVRVVAYLKTLGRLHNLVIVAQALDLSQVALYFYLEVN